MTKWICIAGNKDCDKGLLETGLHEFKYCECIKIKKAQKLFKESNADEKKMYFPKELTYNQLVQTQKGNIQYKELLETLFRFRREMIDSNMHLFLAGAKGTGKSQFASTLLYLYNLSEEKKGYWIDARRLKNIAFSENKKNELYEALDECEFIVIDDLGVEVKTEDGSNDYVKNLLDDIVRSHKGLLVITTNKNPNNLKDYYNNTHFTDELLKGNKTIYEFKDLNIREVKKDDIIDLLP